MKFLFTLFTALLFSFSSMCQLNMQFRSQLAYGASNELANIGGFVDTAGNEYALVGCQTGLSIVDVTNPAVPVQKFLVSGTNSFWREVKVWGKYAYVTTEGCCNGLQIIDLSKLPTSVTSKYWTGTGAVAGQVTRLHSLHIDNGYAYLNGSQINSGACLIVSLADPWNPVYVSNTVLSFTGNNRYVHDCYVRNDTLWGAHIYGGFFSVINVTNKSAPALITTQATPNVFTHNTWLNTSGARTLFTTDEVSNSFMAAYDVTNTSNITLLDKVQLNPGSGAIVHNTHIKNNFAIVSWYKEGVAIIDVSRPDNLIVTGYYDTYAQGSGNGFNGCWGVYPFLPSGNIVASDINNGLFVLTPTYVRGCYLEGTVTDTCSNIPIPNVTVTISTVNITKNGKITGVYKTGTAIAGTYSVTFSKTGYQSKTINGVSLSNGVVTNLNVKLKPTNAVGIAAGSVTNVNCNGAHTGSVSVSTNSGTTPFTWLWSNGTSAQTLSTAGAGSYTVTVTDAAGCKASSIYSIAEPPPIQVNFSSTDITCKDNNDGVITAYLDGGTPAYSYQWTYPPPLRLAHRRISFHNQNNSSYYLAAADSVTITNLSSGNYTLTVTDANNCTASRTYSLDNPDTPCFVFVNLKVFIEGFYRSPNYLAATIDPVHQSNLSDTLIVELHNAIAPYSLAFRQAALLDTAGNCTINFPGSAWMHNYYLVIRHRNSLETWSKLPITCGEENYVDMTKSNEPVSPFND